MDVETRQGEVRIESERVAPAALELTVRATRANLAVIRTAVGALLSAEFAERDRAEWLRDAELALQEACTNVVRHAYVGAPSPGPLTVRAEVTPWLLRFEVTDEGRGFDLATVPPPDRQRPRPGGFGLHVMRSTMSRVSLARRGGRNVLLLEKARPPLAVAPPPTESLPVAEPVPPREP